MVEYSLFELAELWLRAEEPEGNFSDDVKAAFQLIWDVAFQAGYAEAAECGKKEVVKRKGNGHISMSQ